MIKGIKSVQFISSGFRDILFSDGVKQQVQSVADRIRQEANAGVEDGSEGFSATVIGGGYGGGRWVGFVTSIDNAAAKAESENKVLTKAVH